MSIIKITIRTISIVMIAAAFLIPTYAGAQSSTVVAVDFKDPSATSGQQTSGYTDENGKPLTIDEYNALRAEKSKGAFDKNPVGAVLTVAGVIAVIGGTLYAIRRAIKKRQAPTQFQNANQPPMPTPPSPMAPVNPPQPPAPSQTPPPEQRQ